MPSLSLVVGTNIGPTEVCVASELIIAGTAAAAATVQPILAVDLRYWRTHLAAVRWQVKRQE